MFEEHRATSRADIALSVKLSDGSVAVTYNVSASGLCVHLMHGQELGNCVHFELSLASARMTFISEGKVVRRENTNGTQRVAIQFTSASLKPLP